MTLPADDRLATPHRTCTATSSIPATIEPGEGRSASRPPVLVPLQSLIPFILLVLAACGSSPSTGAPPSATTITSRPAASPFASSAKEPSVSESGEPTGPECAIIGEESTLRILAGSWSIVVAAKGESDEPQYVLDFADQVKDFYEDVDDEDTCDGTRVAADAAGLNLETTLLAMPFKISPRSEPEADQYGKVAEAGNQLLSSVDIDGARFISSDCHGEVDDTKACTALK